MKKIFRNEFSWSLSRDNIFRECPRKYYFNYYGFWGGWEHDAPPRIRHIYILKKLKNRSMWIGEKVHDCISRSLKNLSRGIPVLEQDEVISMTLDVMRQDFRNSRSCLYLKDPSAYWGLFEHEYEKPLSNDEWKAAADQVEVCLRNFYSSQAFEKFTRMAPEDFLEIEEFSSFDLEDMKIALKLDCACMEKACVTVWDWKTGKSSPLDYSTQMACYALYAGKEYGVDPKNVITKRFDLLRENILEQSLTDKSLGELLSYIRGSIMDMRNLLADKDRNLAEEDRFSKVAKPSICLNCKFLKVCKPII